MPPTPPGSAHQFEWYGNGHQFLMAALQALDEAKEALRLEIYIFSDNPIGQRFRKALIDAAQRGVHVELLVDGVGSSPLPAGFFDPLVKAGGRVKWFNVPHLGTWALRDHRKQLLVDDRVAFLGGCNLSEEYNGDGVTKGWRDGGISITGPILKSLIEEFARQWQRADMQEWQLVPGGYTRRSGSQSTVLALFIKPGLGASPLRAALREDLSTANDIAITSAYFLPTRRLRMQITGAAKRGAKVKVLLAGKSDVKLMALASQTLYRGLLRAGVSVFEYQPQTLHAKVMVLDDIVYIGSSNLDPRSLRINFEIMLRIKNAGLAARARAQFEEDLRHSRQVTLESTQGYKSWWPRFKQRFAYFVLAKLDPWIAREHMRKLLRKP